MTNINPKLRVSLYIVVCAAGTVLVTYGIITQDTLDALTPIIAGLLAVAGGGLAAANIDVKPRETPIPPAEFIGMAMPLVRAILDEINRLRQYVATSPEIAAATSSGVEYIPDVAPWLAQAQETLGQAQGVADSLHDQGVQLGQDVQDFIGRHRAL